MDLDRRWPEGFDRAKQLNPKPAPVPKPGRPAKLERVPKLSGHVKASSQLKETAFPRSTPQRDARWQGRSAPRAPALTWTAAASPTATVAPSPPCFAGSFALPQRRAHPHAAEPLPSRVCGGPPQFAGVAPDADWQLQAPTRAKQRAA